MSECVELHDSILGAILRDGTDLIVRFTPAYVHRSDGLPGRDPGSGWSADVDIRFGNGAAQPETVRLPTAIADGTLTLGELTLENEVPLPLHVDDRARMVLTLVSGEQVVLTGSSFASAVLSTYVYIEEFP